MEPPIPSQMRDPAVKAPTRFNRTPPEMICSSENVGEKGGWGFICLGRRGGDRAWHQGEAVAQPVSECPAIQERELFPLLRPEIVLAFSNRFLSGFSRSAFISEYRIFAGAQSFPDCVFCAGGGRRGSLPIQSACRNRQRDA